MSRTIHKTDKPVTPMGSKLFHLASLVIHSQQLLTRLSLTHRRERNEQLKWAESKLKTPKDHYQRHGKRSPRVNTNSSSHGTKRTVHQSLIRRAHY